MPGVLGCKVQRVTPEEPTLDKACLGAGGVENATRGGPKVRVLGPPGVGEGVTTRVAPGGSGTEGMEEVATTLVAAALVATFLCLAGGATSCDSTLALFADFSTTALQIS